jgi:hypothetical protein
MDRWLAEIELDTSVTPLAQKIRSTSPATSTTSAATVVGTKVLDEVCPDRSSPSSARRAPWPGDVEPPTR